MEQVLLVIVLLAVAAASVGFLDILIHRPLVTAGLVLTTAVINVATSELPEPIVGRPDDLIFLLVLAAAIGRLLRMTQRTVAHRLLIAVWLLLVLALGRGFIEYGVPAAQEFRLFLKFLAPALYFATVRPHPLVFHKIGQQWVWAGMAIVFLVSARYLAVLTGISLGVLAPTHVSAVYAVRAIPGDTTFTIGLCFLTVLAAGEGAFGSSHSIRRRLLLLLFGTFTILLNRRAVYVAVLVGVAVLIMRHRAIARRVAVPLITVALLSAIPLMSLPEAGPGGNEVATSVTDTGTLEGRMEGWGDLLARQPGGLEWVLGSPLGAGYERRISDREVESNPHNVYLAVLLRLGVMGLVCFLGIYLAIIRVLQRAPIAETHLLSRPCLLVLVASQLVFYVAWNATPEQGVILGLACASLPVMGGASDPSLSTVSTGPDGA